MGRDPGREAGYQHTVLTVTRGNKPGESRGHRGSFRSRSALDGTRVTCAAGKRGPQSHTITAPAPDRFAGILYRRPKTTTRSFPNITRS